MNLTYDFFCYYSLGVTLRVAGGQQLQGYSVQLVQHQGSVKGNNNIYYDRVNNKIINNSLSQ